MSETIKDIKSKLQHMLSISELERSEYNNDARKGVQNAMIQRRKPVSYTHLTLPTNREV